MTSTVEPKQHATTFVLLDPTSPFGETGLDRLLDDDLHVTLLVALSGSTSRALKQYANVENLELPDAALGYLRQVAQRIERPGRILALKVLESNDIGAELGALEDQHNEWRMLLPSSAPSAPARQHGQSATARDRLTGRLRRTTPAFSTPLTGSALARKAPASELAKLDGLGTVVFLEAHTQLFHEGKRGQMACVVVDGSLSVQRDGNVLALLGPGEFVGEISLLSGERCNADVIADTDTSVLALNPTEFDQVLDTCPRIARHVLQSSVRRLHAA